MTDNEKKSNNNTNDTTFASHTAADASLTASADSKNQRPGLSWMGRIGVFLIFPLTIGMLGLYLSYLETLNDESSGRSISLDRDFILPFFLALAMSVVIAVQTSTFQKPIKPLVAWPKVKRVKKRVVRSKAKDE